MVNFILALVFKNSVASIRQLTKYENAFKHVEKFVGIKGCF